MSHTADINRLQLFYRDDGSGAPLLLLHGFMGTSDDWRHVFAAPLDGYRVITPDLRGHGRSTNPSGIFRFADVARDIYALLDHLDINRVKAIGPRVEVYSFPGSTAKELIEAADLHVPIGEGLLIKTGPRT